MSDYVGERSPLRTFGLLSLCRHWKLVAACGALFFIAALLFAVLKPASFTASTQLLVYVREVQPGPAEPVVSAGRADLTQVQNEIEIIRSRGTLAKVVQSLKLADDREFVPGAVSLPTGADLTSGAEKAASEESRTRQDIAVTSLLKRLTVTRVGTSHTILVGVSTSSPDKSAQIANTISQIVLQAPVGIEQDGGRSPLLRERLQGLGVKAYVMTAASAPVRPDGPRRIIIILATTAIGIALGSALALLRDFRNHRIRTAAQIRYLGLECIGAIPLLRRKGPLGTSRPGPEYEAADQSGLRSNPMQVQTLRRTMVAIETSKARTIGVTSSVALEGAAAVAKNLAQVAADCQRKVLLVKSDQTELSRRSMAEDDANSTSSSDKRLQSPRETDVDESTSVDVLEVDNVADADGIAAWRMQCDQSRLDAYDLIIVSLPPLELGAEFRTAALNLDGILLVLKWDGTELERIERAIAVSGVMRSEIIGAVLNMVDERMIGQFGDKFWKAEATLVAERGAFKLPMPVEQAIG